MGSGLDEAMPVPFLAPGELENAGLAADGIKVANPLVAEESVMRSSLRPGLLKTLAYNESHRLTGLRLFEIGHVYSHPQNPNRCRMRENISYHFWLEIESKKLWRSGLLWLMLWLWTTMP